MKVLHVITALNVGGAETMLAKLVEHERMHGYAVQSSVASLMPPGAGADRSPCYPACSACARPSARYSPT